MSGNIVIRQGSVDDLALAMRLFDENVAWLVSQGRESQWGSEPWSPIPARVEFVRALLDSGEVTVAVADGVDAGMSVVADHPMPYVPPLDEPERYLKLLIASPSVRGAGVGRLLIEDARRKTVEAGIAVLRVDCWAGGDRKLVAYYQGSGFTPTTEIEVRKGTSVQVFEWRPGTA